MTQRNGPRAPSDAPGGPRTSREEAHADSLAVPTKRPSRGGTRFWQLSILMVVGWALVAYAMTPWLIRSAYHGESLALLNRVITGQAEVPVSDYLALWYGMAHRATLALLSLVGVGFVLLRWAPRASSVITRKLAVLRAMPNDTGTLLTVALWFGLVTGLGEGFLLWLFQRLGLLTWEMGLLPVTAEIVGVSVVVAVSVFGLLGVLATLAAHLWPRMPIPAGLVLLCLSLTAYDWLAVPLTGRLHEYALVSLAIGIAVVQTRRCVRSPTALFRWSRRTLVVIAPVALLIVVAVQGRASWREQSLAAGLEPPPARAANVIIIIVDALRADHLSAYNYQRPTSPNLDRMAEAGVLFENAFTASSWSPPTHATLLTGRLPHEHKTEWCSKLDDAYPTVAEVLLQQGYRTGGFSANTMFFSRALGFDRGFLRFEDTFYSYRDMISRTMLGRRIDRGLAKLAELPLLDQVGIQTIAGPKRASHVNRSLLKWIDQNPSAPFFAVLNYFDIHGPYVPPEPYRTRFIEGHDAFARVKRIPWRWRNVGTDAQFRYVIDTYDGAIRYVDHQIASLEAALETRGLADRTMLVITSDHGEMFKEHGVAGHRVDLWEAELHVPLILYWPNRLPAGIRIGAPTSALKPLPATIMDLLDLDDLHPFPGPSLRQYWTDSTALGESSYPIAQLAKRPLREDSPPDEGWVESLITPDWHYILHEQKGPRLFDRRRDPGEQRNLAGTARGNAEIPRLHAMLRRRVPDDAMRDLCWTE